MKDSARLADKGILVTRPKAQAGSVVAAISAAGGRPVLFPTMEIVPRPIEDVTVSLREGLDADIIIFVSANAVKYGLAVLKQLGQPWPATAQVAAIGAGTAACLAEHGIQADHYPAGEANSEALLVLPVFQEVSGRKITIMRGVGGREWLAEHLRARGAKVVYNELYSRELPKISESTCQQLLAQWQAAGTDQQVDAVVSTSLAGLQNLFTLLGKAGRVWLQQIPLVVVSQAMVDYARAQGVVCRPYLARGADSASLVETLATCLAQQEST